MNVLMISGDKHFKPGNRRFELQRAAVERLEVVYWGRSSVWPSLPEGHFDVVTTQDPFFRGLFGLFAARRFSARLDVQIHTDFRSEPLWKRVLGGLVLQRADSVRVVSQRVADELKNFRLHAHITVLPVYVDLRAIRAAAPIDLKKDFPQFERTVLVVARLEPEKDVAAAIRLMPEAVRALPKTGLLIAGEGSEEKRLKLLAHELGVERSVIFLGFRTDIGALYKSVDAVVVTSKFEGFGAAIVEALACSAPVISPNVGIAREAGAVVVPRSDLGKALVETLQSGVRGELKLDLPEAEEWQNRWRASLQ